MQRTLAGVGASLTQFVVKAIAGTAGFLLVCAAAAAGRYYPLAALAAGGVVIAGAGIWWIVARKAPILAPVRDTRPAVPASTSEARRTTGTRAASDGSGRKRLVAAAVFIGLPVLALAASVLAGGRFSTVAAPSGVFVTDRFSGDVRFCNAAQCQRLDTYDPWRVVSGPGSPHEP